MNLLKRFFTKNIVLLDRNPDLNFFFFCRKHKTFMPGKLATFKIFCYPSFNQAYKVKAIYVGHKITALGAN